MGIKDLWTILTPFCDRRPLYELQNKKVAVDLSGWVCEAQNVTDYSVQPRMYLRNLYFRTCCLLLLDVVPVFVLEGKAPEVKYKTIAARNAIQFKGAKPKTDNVRTEKGRTRFNHTLKQCQEMLKLMGLACVQGEGEAEALCAHLNEDHLVDGIISQDSDCFAYGAKVVYRNFSISTQGAHAAKGGSVEIYDIAKANTSLTLALLCGSDYSDGVHGIGKEAALKLFETLDDNQILDRLRSWRKNEDYYEKLESKISDKNICTSCGHMGKIQSHNKYGCLECEMSKGCDSTKFKNERFSIKNEINIRRKALTDLEFPDENLINEFLTRKDNVSELNLKWKQPDLNKFIKFTAKYLTWEEIYAFEKFLPILTRWQLFNYEYISKKSGQLTGILTPKQIKKTRVLKGIASFEIIWSDLDNYYESIIPENQIKECDNLEKLWSTIEPQHLVEKAYSELVNEFLESKKPKTKRKKKKIDELTQGLENMSLTEPIVKKTRIRKKDKQPTIKMKTIDSYFTKNVIGQNSSTPVKRVGLEKNIEVSFDLNLSKFGDENDDDISEIIENILNKKMPGLEPERTQENYEEKLLNQSNFFVAELVENDLFEHTFNELCGNEISMDDDDDEETEEPNKIPEKNSYFVDYIPLRERIKKKMENVQQSN